MGKLNELKKLASDKNVVCNWICAVLMLALLIMQFMPYWTFTVDVPVLKTVVNEEQFDIEEPVAEDEETAADEVATEESEEEKEEVVYKCFDCSKTVDVAAVDTTKNYMKCPNCEIGYINIINPTAPVYLDEVVDKRVPEDRTISINDYVWFPNHHKACDELGLKRPDKLDGKSGFENYANKELGETIKVDDIVSTKIPLDDSGENNILLVDMPIFCALLALIGIILAIIKPKLKLYALIPAFCGIIGLWGYFTEPLFKLSSSWTIHVVVCALIAVAGIASLVVRFVGNKKAA